MPCIDVMVGDTDHQYNLVELVVLCSWVSEQIARHENLEVEADCVLKYRTIEVEADCVLKIGVIL